MKKIPSRVVRSLVSTVIAFLIVVVILFVEGAIFGSVNLEEIAYAVVYGGMNHLIPFALYSYVYNVVLDWLVLRGLSLGLARQYAAGLVLATCILPVVLMFDFASWGVSSKVVGKAMREDVLFILFVFVEIAINYLMRPAMEINMCSEVGR